MDGDQFRTNIPVSVIWVRVWEAVDTLQSYLGVKLVGAHDH